MRSLRFAAALMTLSTASMADTKHIERFELGRAAEVIATVTASCAKCDWGVAGSEAAALEVKVDGKYSQTILLFRGSIAAADYRVMLGPLGPGHHEVTLSHDAKASARGAGEAQVRRVSFRHVEASDPEHLAVSLAPILFARPNTIGKFTDTPLLMWYETDRTDRGTRLRYSVVFSNEDGGTPPDRLLATWGRLTDIEYVYGIELDRAGNVLEETFQGKDHEIVPFRGKREGRHPLLYVITDNNMVKDEGSARQRHAPAPVAIDLSGTSRELVMDENPWTYAVTAAEARREGRVVASPDPGSKKIFDPSRYAVLEACTVAADSGFATFTFAIGVRSKTGVDFFDSTAGAPEHRISRSPSEFPNGCFRGAVALPASVAPSDIVAVRLKAGKRKPRKGEDPPPVTGPAHLRRVNRLFLMNGRDEPGTNLFEWSGDRAVALDGEGATLDVDIKAARKDH
jgi:hypothetical protein